MFYSIIVFVPNKVYKVLHLYLKKSNLSAKDIFGKQERLKIVFFENVAGKNVLFRINPCKSFCLSP